ncbi:hypothetical protein [Pantanalinema sp. GBBB05]|uniref:hypothetical protein n=1 Tax=Pantanalinema sp. GBBB05 TaxID=2604139 RepID=UPI001DFB0E6D|nr:hypothetical protein [Pantanalinema sp. GBBB05]
MQVGTLPWLLMHELRLWWRELRGKWVLLGFAIVIEMLLLFSLVISWLLFSRLGQRFSLHPVPEFLFWGAVVMWLFAFFYGFTVAMENSITSLFDRGDLDLLVSSPISSQVIFASRLLGVALKVFLGISLFVAPMSLLFVLIGAYELLGVYPALVGLSLTVASLAMLLTLWLVRLLGARRARTVAQILTAMLAAFVFVGFQLPNLLQGTPVNSSTAIVGVQTWFSHSSWLGSKSWLWFPVKAIFLEPTAVFLTLGISAGLAWLSVTALHHSFISGTQQSVTVKQSRSRPIQDTRFKSGLNRVVLLKEWRIIGRNPYLISQTFLSILFLIPFLIIVLRGNSQAIANLSTLVTSAIPLIGGNLTSALTLICVSGEEAPDLLKSSPTQGTQLRQLKLLAALIPVWLLLSPIFLILILRGESWLPALLVCLGATLSAATLRLWNGRPISLTGLIARQRQNAWGDVLLGCLEITALFTWMFVGFQAGQGNHTLTLQGLGAIAGMLTIAYWRSRILGTSLGF